VKGKINNLFRNHRFLTLIGILSIGLIAAPIVWITVSTLIIDPMAYYWWTIKRVIKSIPQLNYWFFIIGSLGIISLIALIRWQKYDEESQPQTHYKESPIQSLAEILSRSQNSYYYKWLIANKLAIITLDIINNRSGTHDEDRQKFSDIQWNPPGNMSEFLEAGLDKSHMSFKPRRRFLKPRKLSPLDKDLSKVLSFIESQMESS